MANRIILVAAILSLFRSAPLIAAGTPKAMYEAALAREQAVRQRMADDSAGTAVLKDVRAVENAYLAVVRRHPTSSYSDDALWNAGRLALDAFARFGQASDRETGIHLLNLLAAQYPASKLAKRVPDQIAAVPASSVARIAPAGTPPSAASLNENRAPIGRTLAPAEPTVSDNPAEAGSARSRVSNQSARSVTAGRPADANAGRAVPVTETREPIVDRGADGRTKASSPNAIAVIRKVTRTVLPDVVRVTIEMDAEVPFHEERLDNPPRVFLDLQSTRTVPTLVDKTLRFDGDTDVVHQVRIGRHPNATTRIVLDAAGITGYSVYPLYNPYRLVIDCARLTAPKAAAVLPAVNRPAPAPVVPAISRPKTPPPAIPIAPRLLEGMRLSTNWGRTLPSVSPTSAAALQRARAETLVAEATEPTPAAPLAPPALLPPPPTRNSSGGFSMARQLGLGVSRIVIDPGHGGHDPGAKGKAITEAELVLDVALRLEKLLHQQGGVDVVLTRRTDDFIALQERTAIANREGADLFLSIHANASPNPQARGVETYFLNFANNLGAAAVAARENAASGQTMGALPDFVKAIALNNKLDESRDFATEVQHAMMDRLRGPNKTLKNLGVKQAPFVVLIGAAMPSVLAEISFITNPQEAKLLKSAAYRDKIAEALLAAIRKYQSSLHNVTTVAHQ